MNRAAAGLTAAVSLAILLAGCTSEGGGSPADTATTSATAAGGGSTAAVEPSSSGPPAATASAVGTSTLAPVGVGDDGDFGDGLVARVTRVEAQQLSAQGPGEVAGPGVVVTVQLRNGTSQPIDLDGLTVTASYGAGEAASAITSGPAAPPTGRLAPGAEATGSWAFSVPSDQQSSLRLEITSISSPNVITVEG